MKRGKPLERRTPLRPSAEANARLRASQGRIRALSAKRRRTLATWVQVRDDLLRRAGGLCSCCPCRGRDPRRARLHVHHVLPRGRGGKDDGSTPLAVVCPECHDFIHAHPEWSYLHGFLTMSS